MQSWGAGGRQALRCGQRVSGTVQVDRTDNYHTSRHKASLGRGPGKLSSQLLSLILTTVMPEPQRAQDLLWMQIWCPHLQMGSSLSPRVLWGKQGWGWGRQRMSRGGLQPAEEFPRDVFPSPPS